MMFLRKLTSLLLLLPFVAADVHKMKLKKVPAVANEHSPALESMYLAQKYGGQLPIMGAGGAGRKMLFTPEGSDLYWTQEQQELIKGGHNVPLSSASRCCCLVVISLMRSFRLYERAVLYRDFIGIPSTNSRSSSLPWYIWCIK
jgi:hypothetical protein